MGNNNSNEDLNELQEAFTSRFMGYFRTMMTSLDSETLKTSLVDVLHKVLDAILLDDVDSLHASCGFISIVLLEHFEQLLRDINESDENPVKDANPVILATRHGKKNSLLYMSSELGRVLLRLGQKNGGEAARPGDVDEDNHTAFYYAMKSNDVFLMKIISEEMWSDMRTSELDYQLSRAYRELKLKNISMSSEMDAYVIGKLVDFRFFSSDQVSKDVKKNPLDNIVDRMYFLLKAIARLREYMTRDHDSDMEVIVTGEYVAKSLDILKYQLKSTYDGIPWEEMEFCVVLFLRKYKEPSQTQMFYNLVLTPNKISAYLGLFAEVLESRIENITQSNVRDLAKYPKKERSSIVKEIKGHHRLFEDLHGDYEKVRDFLSLELMKSQADLVSEADWETGGLIVMTRALQVIGENLKKSIETPKLSTAEYLLRHFREESRKILEKLRDSLSKDKFLVLREQIAGYGEPFFQMLKADIRELDIKITSCIHRKKEEICNELAHEVFQCGSPEEIQSLFNDRIRFELGWITEEKREGACVREMFQKSFGDQLKLVNELKRFVSGIEEEFLREISSAVETQMEGIGDRLDIYYYQLTCFYNIAFAIENKFLNETFLKRQQTQLKVFQEWLSGQTKDFLEYNEAIRSDLIRIVKGIKPYLSAQEFNQMKNINHTIFYEINMNINRTRWIEELKITLDSNRKSKGLENSDRKILHASKLGALKKLIDENNLFETSEPYDGDPKLRARVDMLILDLMSLLSESHFSHNQFFLDHAVPVAIGKNLRNHLAHGNVLYDVLLSKQQVLSNARKIIDIEDAPPRKIDQVLPCDVARVRDCFDRDMAVVAAQKGLFMAARFGDVKGIARALSSGADVDGRDNILQTPIHMAALGGHYEATMFLCERKGNPLALDIHGRTPLHLAAGSGARKVVAYLVGECQVPVDIRDNDGRSPLLVAAETGQAETIQVVLLQRLEKPGLNPGINF